MSLAFIIAQLIGFVGVGFSVSIYQVNKRETMLLLALCAAVLYAVHYWMIGATTGALLNVMAIARCYVFYKVVPAASNRWIVYCFLAVNIMAVILVWQGPLSLLALGGSMFGIIAAWHREPKLIRRYGLLPPPLWFAYDLLSGSYSGVTIEVIRFCSNLVGQFRFDVRHKKHLRHKLAHPA